MEMSFKLAATRGQRIGIWIIAIFMAVGTIGSFVIIILANQNQKNEQARYTQLIEEYRAEQSEQAKELSDKYYDTLSPYASRVGTFDAASVTELKTEDLVVGDGEKLDENSTFTAYYIGWTPDGKIFDQSIEGDSLKAPFTVYPGAVIEGWSKGVVGMKVGGVRELTIPAEQAYGETGNQNIAPNTPLKFVLLVIPTPEPIMPSQELLDLDKRLGAQ